MNKVILIGRLTGDPELRQTQNGVPVASFRLAVNRRFNRDVTDYINIVAWRGLAENCGKYLVKGQQVAVSGELQTRSYEDKDGNKRTAFEVCAEDVEFLAKAKDGEGSFEREFDGALMEDEKLPFD